VGRPAGAPSEAWPWAVPWPGRGWSMDPNGTVQVSRLCLTAGSALSLRRCRSADATLQQFDLAVNGNLRLRSGGLLPCVALDSGSGPGLVMYGCNTGANEVFVYNQSVGTLCSANLVTQSRLCLVPLGHEPPRPPPPSPPHPAPTAVAWPWAIDGVGDSGNWTLGWDGTVKSKGLCLTAGGSALSLCRCSAASASVQRFFLAPNGNLRLWSGGQSPCVALVSGSGPALVMYGCNSGANEVFAYNRARGTLCSANLVTRGRLCLVARDRAPSNATRTPTHV